MPPEIVMGTQKRQRHAWDSPDPAWQAGQPAVTAEQATRCAARQWHANGEARLMSCRMRRNFWSDCCRNTLRSTTSCSAQRPHAGAWKAKPRFRNAPCTPLGLLEMGGSLQAVYHDQATSCHSSDWTAVGHLAQHGLSCSRQRMFILAYGRRMQDTTHAARLQEAPAMSSRVRRP